MPTVREAPSMVVMAGRPRYVGTRLGVILEGLDLGLNEFARLADVNRSYLSRVLNGIQSPGRDFRRGTMHALDRLFKEGALNAPLREEDVFIYVLPMPDSVRAAITVEERGGGRRAAAAGRR